MFLSVDIPFNNVTYSFSLLKNTDVQRIYVPNFCVIDVFKHHNHSYCFKAFFYFSRSLYSYVYFNSKRELHCAIQKMLQQELLHVKQF